MVEFSKKYITLVVNFFANFSLVFPLRKVRMNVPEKKIWNEGLNFYSELLGLLLDIKFGFSFWKNCSDGVDGTVIYYLGGFLVRFTPLRNNCRQAVKTKTCVENRNFVYSVSSSVNKKYFKILIKLSLWWDSNSCLSIRWIFSIIIRKITSAPP